MVIHATREHAEWSASATMRNWNCPGALVLTKTVQHLEVENEPAAWGTACHEVAEMALRDNKTAFEYLELTIKTKSHEFDVDDEMADTAQQYIDYVHNRMAHYFEQTGDHARLIVEQKFKLDKLKPPFDAGGTADAVIFYPFWRLIEVVDLKTGRGIVVEVIDNKQLRSYGLGALLANAGLKIDNVMSTIVQTRAGHKDGNIRSETIHVTELMDWTRELLKAMKKSKAAADSYTEEIFNTGWAEKNLQAGDHCKFCPAASFCPAYDAKVREKVNLYFDDLDEPQFSIMPAHMHLDRLISVLDAADMITEYLNSCRAMAHKLAEQGVEIKHSVTGAEYILVDRTGRRRWNKDEAVVKKTVRFLGDVEEEKVYNKKLKSPAQMEKVLGKKREYIIQNMIEQPITGSNLVRSDKTSRKAIPPAVNKFFDILE